MPAPGSRRCSPIPARPTAPIERLREVGRTPWRSTSSPDGGLLDTADDLTRLAALTDPVEICAQFVAYVDNVAPDDAQLAVLRESVEAASARDHATSGA